MHSFHVSCQSSEPDPCRLKYKRHHTQQVFHQCRAAQVITNALGLYYVRYISPYIYFHFLLQGPWAAEMLEAQEPCDYFSYYEDTSNVWGIVNGPALKYLSITGLELTIYIEGRYYSGFLRQSEFLLYNYNVFLPVLGTNYFYSSVLHSKLVLPSGTNPFRSGRNTCVCPHSSWSLILHGWNLWWFCCLL